MTIGSKRLRLPLFLASVNIGASAIRAAEGRAGREDRKTRAVGKMDWLFGGFKRSKLLSNLEGSVHRLKIKITAEKAAAAKERREIGDLLRQSREELAKIRAEALFSADNRTEALSILELYLELVKNRVDLIVQEKDCPADLLPPLSSILYAVDRVQIAELAEMRKQLQSKYGTDVVKSQFICPNERLVKCLSLQPPSAAVCIRYCEEIAGSQGVDYTPSDPGFAAMHLPVGPPTGKDVARAPASGLNLAHNGALPIVPSSLSVAAPVPPVPAFEPAPAVTVVAATVPAPAPTPAPAPATASTSGRVVSITHLLDAEAPASPNGPESPSCPPGEVAIGVAIATAVEDDAGGAIAKTTEDDFAARLAALRK